MDIIVPYTILRKVKNEELIIKHVTMIDPVIRSFKRKKHEDKHVITIAKFIKTTWLTRYPWSMEMMYDQG